MYLTGCYIITGKLGNFSWLSCVYCYTITIIRFYSVCGAWLVQYLYRIIEYCLLTLILVNVIIIFVSFVLFIIDIKKLIGILSNLF